MISPIDAMDDVLEQLKDVRRECVEGVVWYRLGDLLDALGIPEKKSARDKASALVDAGCKRYIWQKRRTRSGKAFGEKRFCYVNRIGAERLFIRYGGKLSRGALLGALPYAK